MKKRVLSLFVVLMFLVFSGMAEDWTCPSCGKSVDGNFCSNCGSAKPSDEWTCSKCGNKATGNFCNNCGASKDVKATEENTSDPVDPEEFKQVLNYSLSPITTATVDSYIDMGESMITVAMSNGDSYVGIISDGDGTYALELMNYSASDYSSIESPFNYQSKEFKNVINFLLRNKGCKVKSIISMYGGICSVKDDKGGTYMLTVMCSPAMVMIGLLES